MTRLNEDYEGTRKRQFDGQDSGPRPKRFNAGNEPLLKLLVPNYAAGAILGKGGANLKEMKGTFGGFVRLSSGREYFPGTEERVVVITGEIDQIIAISNDVMEKVEEPGREPSMKNVIIDRDRAKKVKIVLTNGAAGTLIGRSGVTIKAIQEASKAKISVEMLDKAAVPGERVVTVSGNFDERTEACKKIIETVASETTNMANLKTKYENTDMYIAGNPAAYIPQDINPQYSISTSGFERLVGTSFSSRQPESRNQYPVKGTSSYQGGIDRGSHSFPSVTRKLPAKGELEVKVPNAMVGAMLGKQGSIVKDLAQRSGARFKFADKVDGDPDRTLTISGTLEQMIKANSLVNERAEEIRNEGSAPGYGSY